MPKIRLGLSCKGRYDPAVVSRCLSRMGSLLLDSSGWPGRAGCPWPTWSSPVDQHLVFERRCRTDRPRAWLRFGAHARFFSLPSVAKYRASASFKSGRYPIGTRISIGVVEENPLVSPRRPGRSVSGLRSKLEFLRKTFPIVISKESLSCRVYSYHRASLSLSLFLSHSDSFAATDFPASRTFMMWSNTKSLASP